MLFAALAPFFLATACGTAMVATGPPNSSLHPSFLDDATMDRGKKFTATFGVLTTKQVLDKGLDLLGILHPDRIKMKISKQVKTFTNHYGPHPFHVARVWKELLTTDLPDVLVPPEDAKFGHFLICLHWLRKYKTESELQVQFRVNEKTIREWNWYFVDKIDALKAKKIVWPNDWDTVYIISLDCTAMRIEEPFDPFLRKNKKWFSKKEGGPAMNGEIALHLWKNQVVWAWCSGAAGASNDLGVYKQKLKAMIPAGKKIIVDLGYRDQNDPALSNSNSLDSEAVREFKAQAKTRQENFNAILKSYKCLAGRFRHTEGKFEKCFNAVVVLCQYELDEDAPEKYRRFLPVL